MNLFNVVFTALVLTASLLTFQAFLSPMVPPQNEKTIEERPTVVAGAHALRPQAVNQSSRSDALTEEEPDKEKENSEDTKTSLDK